MTEQNTKETWKPIKNKLNPLWGLSYDQVLEKLKEDGLLLEFITNKTQEMCETAVQQNSSAISFINSEQILVDVSSQLVLNVPFVVEENFDIPALITYLQDNSQEALKNLSCKVKYHYNTLDIEKIYRIALKNNPNAKNFVHENVNHLID